MGSVLWSTETIGLHFPHTSINCLSRFFSIVYIYEHPAVITGSTDGIGRQYAIQLAARGVNIVLISRTVEKLMAVANEIEQKHQVKTKWIAADFSQGRPIYDKLRRELDGIPVGILGECDS